MIFHIPKQIKILFCLLLTSVFILSMTEMTIHTTANVSLAVLASLLSFAIYRSLYKNGYTDLVIVKSAGWFILLFGMAFHGYTLDIVIFQYCIAMIAPGLIYVAYASWAPAIAVAKPDSNTDLLRAWLKQDKCNVKALRLWMSTRLPGKVNPDSLSVTHFLMTAYHGPLRKRAIFELHLAA